MRNEPRQGCRTALPPVFGVGVIAMTAWLSLPSAALAGPPFITDDPVPVEPGHWEVNGFVAAAAGRRDMSGLGPSFDINYGAAPNLQLHVDPGLAFDAPLHRSFQTGLSDTELGAKYRFLETSASDWWPQVSVYPLIELPTGNAARSLGAGNVQAFLPVWFQKDYGGWTIYGGGGYWINPGIGNRDFWYTGAVLQRQITDKLALGGELFHQTPAMTGRAGSSGFNLGGVYDLNEHDHLLFSVGRGGLLYAVDAAAVTRPFTYYLALQWTY